MCTAAAFQTKDFYFGRTLDYECSYGECVTVTPRRYPFSFRHMGRLDAHYAMIGMAHVADGYPLYYDAVNEAGLGMAGLNFVGNAQYAEVREGKENVAQFELIPWILGRCATVREARARLDALNLVGTPFSEHYPAAQLHWLLADKDEAVVIESMADGLHVYDDPAGVLTNNPPFPQQLFNLNNYMALSPRQPENRFSGALGLHCYSRGMGAGPARRSVVHVPLRARGLYEAERRLQGHGGGERQPVFPHPRRGRAAARLLRGRARRI